MHLEFNCKIHQVIPYLGLACFTKVNNGDLVETQDFKELMFAIKYHQLK